MNSPFPNGRLFHEKALSDQIAAVLGIADTRWWLDHESGGFGGVQSMEIHTLTAEMRATESFMWKEYRYP